MFHVGLAAFTTVISLAKLHIQIGLCPATSTGRASSLQSTAGPFPVNVIHQVAALSPLNIKARWKRQPRRQEGIIKTASTFVAMLLSLILWGIDINPGPNIQFGLFNARSIVNNEPLVQVLIVTNQLNVLAV